MIAATAGYWIAYTGWNSQPIIVQSLIDGMLLSERAAGLLTSLELLVVALTSFVLAPIIGRFPLRGLCLTGGALVVVGNAGTVGFSGMDGLAAMRLIAGIGGGVLLAGVNSFIASFKDPDRGYAQSNAVTIVATMGVLTVATYLGGKFGHVVVFAVLALVCLLLMVALYPIPQRSPYVSVRAKGGVGGRRGYVLLLAMLIWGTGNGATWAFLLQIGAETGASPGLISASISSWALGGFLGGIAVSWLSGRVDRMQVLTAIIVLNCVNGVLLTNTEQPAVYFVTSFMQIFCVYSVMPCMLGIGAELDQSGGAAAAVGAMFMLTGATGPLVGGLLVETGGYPAIGWHLLVTAIIGWFLLRYANRKTA